MNKYLAEFIGTFALIFLGTGAIVINEITHGAVSHLGVCLVFGLVVMVIVHTLGGISGGHVSPAVTWGLYLAKRFPGGEVVPYMVSQMAGALSASLCLKLFFPEHPTLGLTAPMHSSISAFWFEIFLTAFLMLVILRMASVPKESGNLAGITIGAIVACDALVGGPFTGASMNPFRSLAPAIAVGNFNHIWVYLTAPFIGVTIVALGERRSDSVKNAHNPMPDHA